MMHSLFLREDPSRKFLVYKVGSFHPLKAFWNRDKARDWIKNHSRMTGCEFEIREG